MNWQELLEGAGIPGAPPAFHEHMERSISGGRARSLLLVLPEPPADRAFHRAGRSARVQVSSVRGFTGGTQRFDTAVLVCAAGCATGERYRNLIAALRDVHAGTVHVITVLPVNSDTASNVPGRQDMFGLGFQQTGEYPLCPETRLCVFSFSLSDYKLTPEWLNSRYWANPELFGKYRW